MSYCKNGGVNLVKGMRGWSQDGAHRFFYMSGWCIPVFSCRIIWKTSQTAEMIPFYLNLAHQNSHKKKKWTRKTQHTMDKRWKKKAIHKQQINLINPMVPSKRNDNNNDAERDKGRELPATKVAIVRGSEQTLTSSSTRIGEFGMHTPKKETRLPLIWPLEKISFKWSSS